MFCFFRFSNSGLTLSLINSLDNFRVTGHSWLSASVPAMNDSYYYCEMITMMIMMMRRRMRRMRRIRRRMVRRRKTTMMTTTTIQSFAR